MKAAVEHRVPLSKRALEIVLALHQIKQSDYVFPGQKEGKPLTNMAMLELLKRMGRTGLTVHGFRSSFSRLGIGMYQLSHGTYVRWHLHTQYLIRLKRPIVGAI